MGRGQTVNTATECQSPWEQLEQFLESEIEICNELAAIIMATSFLALIFWVISHLGSQAITTIWLCLNICLFLMILRHYFLSTCPDNVIEEILKNVAD